MEKRFQAAGIPIAGTKELASDLSSLEAGSADVLTLGVAVYKSTDALDVWIPAATGTAV